jgi:SAM-dependent methyltransferase
MQKCLRDVQRRFYSKKPFKDADLAELSFWNDYHVRHPRKEWFCEWHTISDVLIQEVNELKARKARNSRIVDTGKLSVLNVGCGTSSVSVKLANAVKDSVMLQCHNIDFSEESIQTLRARFPNTTHPHQEWIQMDVVNDDAWLNIPPLIDFVLDKGTLDALLRISGPGYAETLRKYSQHISKRLDEDSVIVHVTNEEERDVVLTELFPNLTFQQRIVDEFEYFIHIGLSKAKMDL